MQIYEPNPLQLDKGYVVPVINSTFFCINWKEKRVVQNVRDQSPNVIHNLVFKPSNLFYN